MSNTIGDLNLSEDQALELQSGLSLQQALSKGVGGKGGKTAQIKNTKLPDASEIAVQGLDKSELITASMIERCLPPGVKVRVRPELVDSINTSMGDTQLRQNYRDNLVSFTQVLAEGRFGLGQYVDAVRYVSFKLTGSRNIVAYAKTFPERYDRLIDEGCSASVIGAYVYAYNKTLLVQKIMAQTLTPTHVLNADVFQKAINVQAALMVDGDVSPKVRSDAANSLLTHLKAPETKKIELAITEAQDTSIDELRAATVALAKQQQAMIRDGIATAKDIAHSTIIEGTSEVKED